MWSSGAGRLVFGSSRDDPRGFVIYPKPRLRLEDGSSHETVLEAHPRWKDDGWIRGEFYVHSIESGQSFLARIGFIKPAGPPCTNGVTITVACDGVTVYNGVKLYTGRLADLALDLSRFAGRARILSVDVGAYGDSTQDWLVWTRMRIEHL